MPQSVHSAVQPLVGLRLSIARRAGSMRGFHFGAVSEDESGSWGEYALHLQCPWRIDGPRGVVTGQGDLWEHPTLELPPEDWSYEGGNSLQDVRLGALLGGRDERTRSWVNLKAEALIVTRVLGQESGELTLTLSGGFTLRVFPDTSRDEAWRLLARGGDGAHYVFPDDASKDLPPEA